MTTASESEPDPREELASLAASTRALLLQYEASGADMLPVTSSLEGLGAALPPQAASPRPASVPDQRPASMPEHRPAAAPPPRERPAFGPPARERFVPPGSDAFTPSFQRPSGSAEPRPANVPEHRPTESASRERPVEAVREREPRAPQSTAAPASRTGGEDRAMRLALIAEEVRACTKCVLCEQRKQTVFSRGSPLAELCFVGEGPGADEDAQGEPFVGAAGRLLDKMIAAMGYHRDDVYICNVVKCRPPKNRKPEPNEMEACLPYLREQLTLVQPKVIVALGGTAMTGLIGTTEGITRMRGKWKLYKGTVPIMPTFHPAYLLRNEKAKRDVWNDLQDVMKHLGKPLPTKSGGGRGER